MAKKEFTQLTIRKTEGEWEIIESHIKNVNKKTLASFLISEIKKLHEKYEKCPRCVTHASGVSMKKKPRIPRETFSKLHELSMWMDVSATEVMTRFIIDPLLLEKPADS